MAGEFSSMLIAVLVLALTGCAWGQQDVRAVHVPAESSWGVQESGPNLLFGCSANGKPEKPFDGVHEPKCIAGWTWGCADRSRVLLTAEDGRKWCHAPDEFSTKVDGTRLADWLEKHCAIELVVPSVIGAIGPAGGNLARTPYHLRCKGD